MKTYKENIFKYYVHFFLIGKDTRSLIHIVPLFRSCCLGKRGVCVWLEMVAVILFLLCARKNRSSLQKNSLQITLQLFWHHLLETLSFSHWFTLQKINCFYWLSFLTIYCISMFLFSSLFIWQQVQLLANPLESVYVWFYALLVKSYGKPKVFCQPF